MVPHNPSFAPHPLALLAAALAFGILVAHFLSLPLFVLLGCSAGSSLLVIWTVH